jgi:hypothetical protein
MLAKEAKHIAVSVSTPDQTHAVTWPLQWQARDVQKRDTTFMKQDTYRSCKTI